MTEEQLEAFNHIAYAYRTARLERPADVAEAFKRLVDHVESLIDDAVQEEAMNSQLHYENLPLE